MLCLLTRHSVVRGASWSSLYDVRADLTSKSTGSGPTIALQYRANITQRTGEDWDAVVLTLSTASPLLGSDIPVLQPWKIGQFKPAPPPRPMMMMASMAAPAPPMMKMRKSARAGSHFDSSEQSRGSESLYVGDAGPQVAVSEGAIASTFEIDGFSTIPSDNSSHKVSIAVSIYHLMLVLKND